MPIRFHCPQCDKLIEADDCDANEQVLCYYCRQPVTVPCAPASSVARPAEQTAQPQPITAELTHISSLRETDRQPVAVQPMQRPGAQPPSGSKWMGIAGLTAAIVTVLLVFFWFVAMMSILYKDLVAEGLQNASQEQIQKFIEPRSIELMQQSSFVTASVVILACALVAFGFSIAGIAANSSRKMAIAGLIIAAPFLICQCGGLIGQLSGAAIQ